MDLFEQLDWLMYAYITGLQFYDEDGTAHMNPVHDAGCCA